jgi:hypothetical protein
VHGQSTTITVLDRNSTTTSVESLVAEALHALG